MLIQTLQPPCILSYLTSLLRTNFVTDYWRWVNMMQFLKYSKAGLLDSRCLKQDAAPGTLVEIIEIM